MTADSLVAGAVTIVFDRKTTSVSQVPGETILETARRAGLTPPFSCEAGNCGTCMAKLTEGAASIRVHLSGGRGRRARGGFQPRA